MIFKKTILFTFSLFVPLMFVSEAQATIYKCVNTKEEVYYNDKPCPLNNEESQIKAVKDPVGGYIPPELKYQKSNENSVKQLVQNSDNSTINDTLKKKKSSESSNMLDKESDINSGSYENNKTENNNSVSALSNKKQELQKSEELIFH